MKDFLGRDIKEGDYIVYGRRDGNSSKTPLYRVVSTEGDLKVRALVYNKYGRQWDTNALSRIHSPENVVIVPEDVVPQEAKDRYELLTSNNPYL